MAMPQGLTDALAATQAAKDAADVSLATKSTTAAAVVSAQNADSAAAIDLATKTAALDSARQALEAIEDAYFKPGATVPAPVVPPPA
jgi:hypothetical protein